MLRALNDILYTRNDIEFARGTFRVRGDKVDVFPAYESDFAYRIEFFGDVIDRIHTIDCVTADTVINWTRRISFPQALRYYRPANRRSRRAHQGRIVRAPEGIARGG